MFLIFFSFSSCVSLSFSRDISQASGGLGGGLGGVSMPCMQHLIPCQPYLQNPSAPPSSCCVPLKDMIANDAKCLCDIFNNPTLLKSLNVTQNDALKLPKACDAKVDISVCNKDAAPPTSSATPPAPASPSDGTKKNAANGLSLVGGYGVMSLFMSLFFSVAL
ncbi:hypothetical protein IFM89_036959 [Coptis chinensis]|uniref:Bifunctional inhibitor/plant lipid transfer protein/seed storage helical domain-containing protein n=1 Tax=Coptis chinensis TaxID=261450 RepID=A0A835HJD4_9MAGN|nr:hypothetical protein IFM89_036959 [Coptis chinensis]